MASNRRDYDAESLSYEGETARCFETLVSTYKSTCHYNPEERYY